MADYANLDSMVTMVVGKICRSCPFSRRSVPAFYAVDNGRIARAAARCLSNNVPLACVEGPKAPGEIRACAGSLIFRKNANLIYDLDPDDYRALVHVDCSHEVFASWDEFAQHHGFQR